MLPKHEERIKAIGLREKGLSYSEIMAQVPVSQSTLSLWLRDVVLDDTLVKALEERKRIGQQKGASSRKTSRLQSQQVIELSASKDIEEISDRELWLLGVIAYWCEGSKQKEHIVSCPVIFTNSDPVLLKLFIKWLKRICKIKEEDISYVLCIHESGNISRALIYWCDQMKVSEDKFSEMVIKKHALRTNRKNIGDSYYGLLRIKVRRSTYLNRKIKGWVLGIGNYI